MASDQAPALRAWDSWDGGEATVTVQGEVDASTEPVLSELLGEVAARNPQRLIIDVAGAGFIDSAGLRAFVRVRRELPPGCAIVVRSAQPRLRQVFEMTGLNTAFAFE